jgi:hypothetical protein
MNQKTFCLHFPRVVLKRSVPQVSFELQKIAVFNKNCLKIGQTSEKKFEMLLLHIHPRSPDAMLNCKSHDNFNFSAKMPHAIWIIASTWSPIPERKELRTIAYSSMFFRLKFTASNATRKCLISSSMAKQATRTSSKTGSIPRESE